MPRMAALAGMAAQFGTAPESTDAELIDDFVRHRDEEAFAAIVRRHGRSVHGVCRRILGNATDADDAFQATFLVLARKAHRVAFQTDVSAWLFAVAVRASRELLRRRTRRANRETTGPVPEIETSDHLDLEAGRVVLDEVAKLSDSYRSAVVLCELDGVGRTEAARRLGIPEGTLSSRLAAARKQLAARLTARGVTLAALAPFGGFVPSALAASVVSSEVPSPTVSELMEVLMRTGVTHAAKKWLAALGVLAAVVGGLSFGEDPKPQPIQPAAAKVIEQDEPKSQLILTFREEVRYLATDGREIQRIDYSMAKKADPELHTGTLVIGSEGFKLTRNLPHCGRPGPGGIVPLESVDGLKLLTPGPPPKVKRIDATPHSDRVAGWSADGKQLYSSTFEANGIWGITGYKTFRVNASTGEREELPIGKEHCLIDVSADGKWFLTKRHRTRIFGVPGFQDGYDICVLNPAGDVQQDRGIAMDRHEFSEHRLAPGGKLTAEIAKPKDAAKGRPIYSITERSRPNEIAMVYVSYRRDDGEAECRAVAWSPDGKQIVSLWTPPTWKDKLNWYVVVSDGVDGKLRTVATIETKGDEQIRSLDWR
jgi:RNA polymerase sigma factor (sigma-70 family)